MAATTAMMSQKKATELAATLEGRRAELEKARADLGLSADDTFEAYERRVIGALERYNTAVLPPLRDQVSRIAATDKSRQQQPPQSTDTPTVSATTTNTVSPAVTKVQELKAQLAETDQRLAQLERDQAVRDVTMDAVAALEEKTRLETALLAAEREAAAAPSQPQSTTQTSETTSATGTTVPETSLLAAERWVAKRVDAIEATALKTMTSTTITQTTADAFATSNNSDLPRPQELGFRRKGQTNVAAATTAVPIATTVPRTRMDELFN